MKRIFALMLLAAVAACSAERPCPVCYEDEWSREPFPGQPKQHIPPLTPEDVKNAPPAAAWEFLGEER